MNDYLTNLAARRINLAPALQPRLHSQFEPAPRNGALNAARPHTALPDEATLAEESAEVEYEPSPFRARPNSSRQAREAIAPAPRETPAAPKLVEKASEKSDESVIASAAKQSLPEKEIASSPEPVLPAPVPPPLGGGRQAQVSVTNSVVEGAPRNDIRPTFQMPSDKVVTSPPAISHIDAVQPHAAKPDEAALAVESENEPTPFRTLRSLNHHTRESVAPAAHTDESVVPAPRETLVTSQPSEKVTTSRLAFSLNGKSAQPQLTIHSPELVGSVHTANPAATAADSRARVTPSFPETVKAPQTEIPPLPLSRKNDTESSRLAEERRTQTIRREQLVVTEVIRQSAPDQDPIFPQTVVTEASPKTHGRPQKQPAERETQTISREQLIVTEVRRHNEPERGATHAQAVVTELPPKAHEHPQKQPAAFQPIIAQPRIAPFFENRHDDRLGRGDDREAPPTPTIQVTIGRIEVRATQPTSSSSPKSRPARPVMSLDEYLRRRGNGGAG